MNEEQVGVMPYTDFISRNRRGCYCSNSDTQTSEGRIDVTPRHNATATESCYLNKLIFFFFFNTSREKNWLHVHVCCVLETKLDVYVDSLSSIELI